MWWPSNRYTEMEFSIKRDRVVGKSIANALGNDVGMTQPYMQQAVESGQTIRTRFHMAK